MSSFTYSSKAAVAAAATAAGEAVDHIRRLSSSSEEENMWYPFKNELNYRLAALVLMLVVLAIGFFIVAALNRCVNGDPDDHQQASFQPAPERILPLMSIEPALNFTNRLTLAGGADLHPECTICLSEFVDDEEIRILSKCKHGFHAKCIETWLLSRSSCPTCRTSCVKTSVKQNPPENQQQQQQQQNDVDLEAANPPETEMMVLRQQQQQNDVDIEAANLPEPEMVVLQKQQQQSTE